jgi:hypothetical protein
MFEWSSPTDEDRLIGQVVDRLLAGFPQVLKEARLDLREVGTDGGYPVFSPVSTGRGAARPKNLIFGSSRKPVSTKAQCVTTAPRGAARQPGTRPTHRPPRRLRLEPIPRRLLTTAARSKPPAAYQSVFRP